MNMNTDDTLDDLKEKRQGMKLYLSMKVKMEDWHGVADAAMDLREIDAQIEILKRIDDGD